jgi:hypothetical protein
MAFIVPKDVFYLIPTLPRMSAWGSTWICGKPERLLLCGTPRKTNSSSELRTKAAVEDMPYCITVFVTHETVTTIITICYYYYYLGFFFVFALMRLPVSALC